MRGFLASIFAHWPVTANLGGILRMILSIPTGSIEKSDKSQPQRYEGQIVGAVRVDQARRTGQREGLWFYSKWMKFVSAQGEDEGRRTIQEGSTSHARLSL